MDAYRRVWPMEGDDVAADERTALVRSGGAARGAFDAGVVAAVHGAGTGLHCHSKGPTFRHTIN